MNRKEKIVGGGALEWGEYTHLITVERFSHPDGTIIIGYEKDYNPELPPNPPFDLGACQKFDDSSFSLKCCYTENDYYTRYYIESPDNREPELEPLFLGRSDTKTLITPISPTQYIVYDQKGTLIGQLFSEADVGKEIPIWISNTPPHGTTIPTHHDIQGATSANCHLLCEVA